MRRISRHLGVARFWSIDLPLAQWKGVATRHVDGVERVTSISLSNLSTKLTITSSGDYFGHLTCLEAISLDHNDRLSGTIMEIYAPTITSLNLSSSPNLMGSVRDLKNFPKLKRLRLDHMPMVTGNLRHMPLTFLNELNLSHTKVMGSISYLRICRESLQRIYLASCFGIEGDLSEDLDFPLLEELDLASTGVKGGFAALPKSPNLRKLNLSNTKVEGSLCEISDLISLTHLYLDGTATCGIIGHLDTLKSLRSADLDFSNVEATREEMEKFRHGHPGAVLLVRKAAGQASLLSGRSIGSTKTQQSSLSRGRFPH